MEAILAQAEAVVVWKLAPAVAAPVYVGVLLVLQELVDALTERFPLCRGIPLLPTAPKHLVQDIILLVLKGSSNFVVVFELSTTKLEAVVVL